MCITTVLFDLDGTLLPMDQDEFTKGYFQHLAAKLAPFGYEPQKLISTIWTGTAAMIKNDGSVRNEDAFWREFSKIYGQKAVEDKPLFDSFYENEFQMVKSFCDFAPQAAQTVREIKKMGCRVVLATNPIFPAVATKSRIRWAGLDPEDFELITTYENTGYCKPNPEYYRDILNRIHVKPENCLMTGNDVTEDMVAETLGMKVFLLTDCLINKEHKDISAYPQGSFEQLLAYVKKSV